jgi:NAD dependent epimerase/dehydratase family enzyme
MEGKGLEYGSWGTIDDSTNVIVPLMSNSQMMGSMDATTKIQKQQSNDVNDTTMTTTTTTSSLQNNRILIIADESSVRMFA